MEPRHPPQHQERQIEAAQTYHHGKPDFRPIPTPNPELVAEENSQKAGGTPMHCLGETVAASPADEDMFPKDSPPNQGCPSSPGSQDEMMTGLSDFDEASPAGTNSDDALSSKAVRLLHAVLEDEFDVRPGISRPPDDLVDDAAVLLSRISLYLKSCERKGYLTPCGGNALAPGDSSTATGTPTGIGNANTTTPARKRRPQNSAGNGDEDDDECQDEDADEDDGGGAQIGPSGQKHRKKSKTGSYACPFRKRNPLRFNVRDHEYCAKAPSKSMADLKKHLRHYHQQKEISFRCVRCHTKFPTVKDCEEHMREDSTKICSTRTRAGSPDSPEEAISEDVEKKLCSRSEHFTWVTLWQVLFPRDKLDDIPGPDFEPPVELYEVVREYNCGLSTLRDRISATIDADAFPDAASLIGPDLQPVLSLPENMENTFRQFMDGIFEQARLNTTESSSTSGGPNVQTAIDSVTTSVPTTGSRTPPSLASPRPSSTVSASTATSSGLRSLRPGPPHNGWSTPVSNGTSSPTPSRHSSRSNLNPRLASPRSNRGLYVDNVSDHGGPPSGPLPHHSMGPRPVHSTITSTPNLQSAAHAVPAFGMQTSSATMTLDSARVRSSYNNLHLQSTQSYAQRTAQSQAQPIHGGAGFDGGGRGFPDGNTMQFSLPPNMTWDSPAYHLRPSSSPDDLTNCFPDLGHVQPESLDAMIAPMVARSGRTGWPPDVLSSRYGAGRGADPGRPGPGGTPN
ncbi:hypothetical protein QBC34DRAFT_382485 [Podospora aff. communis PSN243]|uniref:C2H2-type domain-containing protein n=1 Tax=Podospora aff. communis PSN243 TaxID=3040156 RepID=A0AAV9GFK5_9PEZI|nr:hypothetical protein QBC34DRAFT_382485 [Podospora aff. communis PSN243]